MMSCVAWRTKEVNPVTSWLQSLALLSTAVPKVQADADDDSAILSPFCFTLKTFVHHSLPELQKNDAKSCIGSLNLRNMTTH